MKASLDPPEVSICVVSLNGHDRLHRLLDSLAEHTSHIDYEVVIVESGSRVRDYVGRMNRALRAGAGRIIVGLNDDVQVAAGWLDPLIAAIDAGAWVCYPDQSTTDGNQCICGWCVVWERRALYGNRLIGGTQDLFYDEQFVLWGSDIDLVKRLHALDRPPVRVKIPEPLIHDRSTTVANPKFEADFNQWGGEDLGRYEQKWGTLAQTDKFELAP
jgi:glycosyltransferase involved in cell wall biosynthesis